MIINITSNVKVIRIILRITYFIANLIINQLIYIFSIGIFLFSNSDLNRLLSLIIGIIVSEISYRIAIKISKRKFDLLHNKLINENQQTIKFIEELYLFLTNVTIVIVVNMIAFVSYSLIINIFNKI